MRSAHLSLLKTIFIVVLLAVLMGCSRTGSLMGGKTEPPDAAARAEAEALLAVLKNSNAGLNHFKGIGKIKVWQKGILKVNEQVAWIGSENSKISLVVLIGGQPAVRMASDGKWFYYYEVGQNDPVYKKFAASNANLKRIISISIQTSDILDLLAGRIPIRKHQRVVLENQETWPGYILVLKKRWWGVAEKIYVDKDKMRAHQVEFFSRTGSLIYRARFDEMQTIKGYRVPVRLSITNEKDADFELDVRRFWADVTVNDDMFVLKPPE